VFCQASEKGSGRARFDSRNATTCISLGCKSEESERRQDPSRNATTGVNEERWTHIIAATVSAGMFARGRIQVTGSGPVDKLPLAAESPRLILQSSGPLMKRKNLTHDRCLGSLLGADRNSFSDNHAMLEFRRNSNDRRTFHQLLLFTVFSVTFGFFVTGSILKRNVPCILISCACFAAGCFALVRSLMSLLHSFDHLCTFTPTYVQWSATNDVYPAERIDSCDVRAVYIDLDDGGLSFDTAGPFARGIRADIGLTTDKLRIICDYIITHWTLVTVYCIERGVRSCVSRVDRCQNI